MAVFVMEVEHLSGKQARELTIAADTIMTVAESCF